MVFLLTVRSAPSYSATGDSDNGEQCSRACECKVHIVYRRNATNKNKNNNKNKNKTDWQIKQKITAVNI